MYWDYLKKRMIHKSELIVKYTRAISGGESEKRGRWRRVTV